MKVTITLSDFQLMKALALTPATEEQAEKVMAAIRETSELDITEFLSSDEDCKEISLAFSLSVIAAISKARNVE